MRSYLGWYIPHHLILLHGHMIVTAMTVYALGAGVHHLNQVDKVLRRNHEWEQQIHINNMIKLTPHHME